MSYTQDLNKMLCDCIILKPKIKKFGDTQYCNFDICGKKMIEWVYECVNQYNITEVEIEENEKNIFPLIRPLLKDAVFTLVIKANMPLVYTNTINDFICYAKRENRVALKAGPMRIFKTSYIKDNDVEIKNLLEMSDINLAQFKECVDLKSYFDICRIMQKHIIDSFLEKGVFIKNPNSVTIDANSFIDSNVTIDSNVVLNNVTLAENCTIGPNNVLTSSTIDSSAIIGANNVITDSKLGKYCEIGNNCNIVESYLGENCSVNNSSLTKVNSQQNVKIFPYNVLEEVEIGENCVLESFIKLRHKRIKQNYTLCPSSQIDTKEILTVASYSDQDIK